MHHIGEEDIFAYLSNQLKQHKLWVLVGSATSLPFNNPETGKLQPGLCSTSTFVNNRRKSGFSFISEDDSFLDTCTAIEAQLSRQELESCLLEEYDKPTIPPTLAHTYLACLPFESYITTNYDTMLERAISQVNNRVKSLVNDRDLGRLNKNDTAVIKYHGCVQQPESMVATRSDYQMVEKSKPLLFSKLESSLAEKTLLVVGFALDDPDFERLITRVQESMGKHSPKIIAVVLSASSSLRNYWSKDKNCTVVEADLTAFLSRLAAHTSESRDNNTTYNAKEDWMKNDFFISLQRIKTLPSETQVVDAYLEHFEEELSHSTTKLDDLILRAKKAADLVLSEREHYIALKRVSEELLEHLSGAQKISDAEMIVRELQYSRQLLAKQFESTGASIIEKSNSILIFSQSKRVIKTLLGVPKSVQASCHLYIAECRPKSPKPFQDALSICEHLLNTEYKISIIPDVAMGNLISRGQVDQILMGAHSVYTEKGLPYAFVNTCGTNLISYAACSATPQVPIQVLAEKVKYVEHNPDSIKDIVSYDEEEDLFSEKMSYASNMGINSEIAYMNIGYDLCFITNTMSILTPDA